MPTPSTRGASAASRKVSSAASRKVSSAASRKVSSAASRKESIAAARKHPHAVMRGYPGAGPIVDAAELDEARRELRDIDHELLLVKCDIAWQRTIDHAIRVCRLLRKGEVAEALKYRPDQPRIPAGNTGGGQWVDDGGGGAAAAAASATLSVAEGAANISGAAARLALQRLGVAAGAAALPATAVAAGILMATAGPAGGPRDERTETLADGTVVTISRGHDETAISVSAVSPDGTITTAKIEIDGDGNASVREAGVELPNGETHDIDPTSMTAATSAIITAATGGNGGKTQPTSPDKSGIAATPPPEDENPEQTQTRETAADSSRTPRELNLEIGNEQRALLNEFFGSIEKLGKSPTTAALPPGLTRGTLLKYREVAIRALNPTGAKRVTPLTIEVQTRRLKAIEKALEILK